MIERTFVMLKPDAIQRGLMSEIPGRMERKGYKPVAMKFMRLPKELAERHYAEHKGKGFYPGHPVHNLRSQPCYGLGGGMKVVTGMRAMMGKTNPKEAAYQARITEGDLSDTDRQEPYSWIGLRRIGKARGRGILQRLRTAVLYSVQRRPLGCTE